MLDRPMNIVEDAPAVGRERPVRRWTFGLLALIGAGWLFWRSSKSNKAVERPTTPGEALAGWKISPEDAQALRQVADPDNPAGKAKLRAGPTIQR